MSHSMKAGDEFEYSGATFKVTVPKTDTTKNVTLQDGRFLAIMVADNGERDTSTYNAYVRRGDFRTDNALFTVDADGKISIVQAPTGVIGLGLAKPEYREALGF